MLLDARLRAFLHRDRHASADGYFIRSLYFDDATDSACFDKLAGVQERAKYRLRTYNLDPGMVYFECKRKHGMLTDKSSVPVDSKTATALISGAALPSAAWDTPLLAEFLALRSAALLRPRVLVDYTRMAYEYPEEHTRVTLDYDVRSGMYRTNGYFDPIVTLPVSDGGVVLEIKFDRRLPDYVRRVLAPLRLLPEANSKYCSCVLPTV